MSDTPSFTERLSAIRQEQRKLRREKESVILRMRKEGKSNGQIGREIGLSAGNVSMIYSRAAAREKRERTACFQSD